jgi:predicted Zn-dependent protease
MRDLFPEELSMSNFIATTARHLPTCLCLCLLPACVTEELTNRTRMVPLISEAQANEMGAQAFQQLLGEAKVGGTPQQNAAVERVGKRIAAVTDAYMGKKGRELFQWDFKVIADDKTVNAFCLPGGKVAFYTAILPVCQDENGIAVVMGHEVAHAYLQHGAHRISTSLISQVGLEAVQLALGGAEASETSKIAIAALGVGYQVGIELPFSRADESEADHAGLKLMAEAGYDPRAAVAFWQRMSELGGGGTPEFLSTHPGHETRIEQLEKLMPEAIAIYERSRGGGGPTPAPGPSK